jgi:hypothetical protein
MSGIPTVSEIDLRTLDRLPVMTTGGLIPQLSCRRCSANPPFAGLLALRP